MGTFALEYFIGLGALGIFLSLAVAAVVDGVALIFVSRHMINTVEPVPVKNCFIAGVLLIVVQILSVLCLLYIPIPFIREIAFIGVLYQGSIAVVEGMFEIKEGGALVLVMMILVNMGISSTFRATVGSPVNPYGGYGFYSASSSDFSDVGMDDLGYIDGFGYFDSEEEEREIEIIGPESVQIRQAFRSEKIEQDEFAGMRGRDPYIENKIAFGVFFTSDKSLDMGPGALDLVRLAEPGTSTDGSVIDDWPTEGTVWESYDCFKLVAATESGGILPQGERPGQNGYWHYYAFFAVLPETEQGEWYLVFAARQVIGVVMLENTTHVFTGEKGPPIAPFQPVAPKPEAPVVDPFSAPPPDSAPSDAMPIEDPFSAPPDSADPDAPLPDSAAPEEPAPAAAPSGNTNSGAPSPDSIFDAPGDP